MVRARAERDPTSKERPRDRRPADERAPAGPDRLASLHRTAGNQAIQSAVEGVRDGSSDRPAGPTNVRGQPGASADTVAQPKSTVREWAGGPEREAEQATEAVVQRSPDEPGTVSVSRRPIPGTGQPLDREQHSRLESLRGGGKPLERSERSFFEPRLGRRFGDVRVHTGPAAASAADSLDAAAFTAGRDVVFGSGNYAPETAEGRRLLAHELTHVVQQDGNRGAVGAIQRQRAATRSDSAEQSPAEGVAALFESYRAGEFGVAELAGDLVPYADSQGVEIAREMAALADDGLGLTYALVHVSSDEELRSFDVRLLQGLSGTLGSISELLPLDDLSDKRQRVVDALAEKGVEIGDTAAPGGRDPSPGAIADRLVAEHLSHLVENGVGGEPSFSPSYRENLVRQVVADMAGSGSALAYEGIGVLADDVEQRVRTSLYTRKSQGHDRDAQGKTAAFSYPNRASDGTENVDPQVNVAAEDYWEGPIGNYHFELSSKGQQNPYEAVTKLFVPQEDPTDRTLIHCDYLLSVVQYRSWAETIGPDRFNEAVKRGDFTPVLRWDGFSNPAEKARARGDSTIPSPGMADPFDVPAGTGEGMERTKGLERTTASTKSELRVGDHVRFYNHESYDALIEHVDGIWRLENAILIDRSGGTARYQGHGYYSPVPKSRLLQGMIAKYNERVRAARQYVRQYNQADTPRDERAALRELARYNVFRDGDDWVIRGNGFCDPRGQESEWAFRELDAARAPGLMHPCDNEIKVWRPNRST